MNNSNEHKDIEQLLTPLSRVSLSHTEKARMRQTLSSLPIPSPINAPRPSPFAFPFLHPLPSIAFLLILTITTSTVSAAEGALPGDILYPIKVKLTEEVRTSLTFSPEKKAAWEVERAERRIEEATRLAVEDTLDDTVRTELNAHAEAHIVRAEEISHEIPVSDDHEDARIEIEERVRLARHSKERILDERPTLAIADTGITSTASMALMVAPPTEDVPEVRAKQSSKESRAFSAFSQEAPSSEAAFMARIEDNSGAETARTASVPTIEEDRSSASSERSERVATSTTDDDVLAKEQKRDGARARAVRTVMDRRIKQAEEAVARATERRSKESIDAAKERLEYAKKLQEEAHKDEKALLISEEAATEAVAVIERIVHDEHHEQEHDADREDTDTSHE